jgi:hypothetical protein
MMRHPDIAWAAGEIDRLTTLLLLCYLLCMAYKHSIPAAGGVEDGRAQTAAHEGVCLV